MYLFEPWPVGYKVNARSPYGPRVHPITGKRTFHHGVDVALPVGTPLIAPADGVVVHKNRTASAGVNLIIRHEGTWHTVYYHLQKPSHLALNAEVKAGDLIAYSGNTGASTGPHLHWELRRTRTWGDTVNVMDYVVGPYVETVAPEPVKPEPVVDELPEPIPVPKPLPDGVPVNKPEPVRRKPKWEFSPALLRGFERIRRQSK
jgi:murein DD-endopeptidase MepM/ murein hydrolase activator NlpD